MVKEITSASCRKIKKELFWDRDRVGGSERSPLHIPPTGSDNVKVRPEDGELLSGGLLINGLPWFASIVHLLEVDAVETWKEGDQGDDIGDMPDQDWGCVDEGPRVEGGQMNPAGVRNDLLLGNLEEVRICQLLKAQMLQKKGFDLKFLLRVIWCEMEMGEGGFAGQSFIKKM